MRLSHILAAGALAALGTPALAQDAADQWSRAELPSGYASVETPCGPGLTESNSNDGGEAVRCMEGLVEIGVGLTNATAFGMESYEGPVFDAFLETARQGSDGTNVPPIIEFRGRRALILGNATGSMALVEVSDDAMLLFMVRPLPGKTPSVPLPDLLDRMMASLEINPEGMPS